MKKRILAALLALVMVLSLLPAAAFAAAEKPLPDWYFLFAIFKNVDADGTDKNGNAVHVTYSMSQDEIDLARYYGSEFEVFMNQVGIMRAHVDVVEIDTTVTELYNEFGGGSYLSSKRAASLLEGKVDLDQYDHVTCIISLDNLKTSFLGVTGDSFENGTGHSCLNFVNREQCLKSRTPETNSWILGNPVHEFLHFIERLSKKWGAEFSIHDMRDSNYYSSDDNARNRFTDIMRNQYKGDAQLGTGVHPAAWQYPPHVLRTMTELTIPSGVTNIGNYAFRGCTGLTELTISSGVASIGNSAFRDCTALTRIFIPASVISIGEVAFYKTGLTDVYYAGTEAQWKAIEIGGYNGPLNRAAIHCNCLMADVKTSDWFAQGVAWALENGVTNGTGNGNFSPARTCNQGEILTFLWRAVGQPDPAGAVSGTQFYAKAAQWAKEQGLTDNFNANAPCTRADAVTYLWKLAGSPSAGNANFSDVPASASYAQAVAWAVSEGVTNGTSATTFSPNDTCTRGQIVTFLYRALG